MAIDGFLIGGNAIYSSSSSSSSQTALFAIVGSFGYDGGGRGTLSSSSESSSSSKAFLATAFLLPLLIPGLLSAALTSRVCARLSDLWFYCGALYEILGGALWTGSTGLAMDGALSGAGCGGAYYRYAASAAF